MMSIKEKINELDKLMKIDYVCLDKNKNPFSRNSNLSKKELEEVISQYTIFPKNIVAFIVTALYNLNYHGFTTVSAELMRNLMEELGVSEEYHGDNDFCLLRPHYVILREGVYRGLGFDIKNVTSNNETDIFLTSIKEIMDQDIPAKVAGAIYALESSAIPELNIILSLTERLFELSNRTIPETLINFFSCHIAEIEIAHRDRLIDTFSKYITLEKDMKNFEKGYRKLLTIMDNWWISLSKTILSGNTNNTITTVNFFHKI